MPSVTFAPPCPAKWNVLRVICVDGSPAEGEREVEGEEEGERKKEVEGEEERGRKWLRKG